MKRTLATALFLAVAGLAGSSSLYAQDAIRYLDRKTMREAPPASGSIVEESPAQVVYKPAGVGTKSIAAQDIIDITYDVPASVKLIYRSALADERKSLEPSTKEEDRKKAFNEALKSYQEILSKLAGEKNKFAERQMRYKIARLQAGRVEDDPSQLDAAIAGLAKFKQDYPDGWQLSHCAKLLAQLQLDKGDIDGARKTFEELAAAANISKEIRRECELRVVETLILAKKVAEAEARLQAMVKEVPASDPLAARVAVYQAECQGASGKLAEAVAQLEGIIAKTGDKDLKALAYNALGDCYRLNRRPKEALWPYLWVDVIYHQDRQEHAKAMAELARLFEDQGDTARAKEYKDKIRRETR
jgi:predicted negative regulator of RcsB-dependent stress response